MPQPTGRCKCGAESRLRLVCVRSRKTGQTKTVAFSEVGSVKVEDKHTRWDTAKILGEWDFDHWHEICGPCFYGLSGQAEAFAA